MSGKTPGQAEREALRLAFREQTGACPDGPDCADCDRIDAEFLALADAYARALAGRQPQPACEDLAAKLRETAADNIRLRAGLADGIARLEASAAKTAPSKKSQIETGCAKVLRELLEGK